MTVSVTVSVTVAVTESVTESVAVSVTGCDALGIMRRAAGAPVAVADSAAVPVAVN